MPESAPRFGGQFVLDSQADQQLVFVKGIGGSDGFGPSNLTRLALTHAPASGASGAAVPAGVDDIRWTDRRHGTLYVVDNGTNTIYAVDGPFAPGTAYASLDAVGAPDSSGNAPSHTTEVDALDTTNGALSPFLTGLTTAKGLVYVNPAHAGEPDNGDGRGEAAHDARHHGRKTSRHARRS